MGAPIQWLTIGHKIPCWRGDGSRSVGYRPAKSYGTRSHLKFSYIIHNKSLLYPGPAARGSFLVVERGWGGYVGIDF